MITGIRAGRHYFSASPTIQPTQHSKGEQSSLHRHMCSNCEEKQRSKEGNAKRPGLSALCSSGNKAIDDTGVCGL